jgi:hypothetical protein
LSKHKARLCIKIDKTSNLVTKNDNKDLSFVKFEVCRRGYESKAARKKAWNDYYNSTSYYEVCSGTGGGPGAPVGDGGGGAPGGTPPPPTQDCPDTVHGCYNDVEDKLLSLAPNGIPQDYYDTLNDEEKKLCHENSYRCLGVYQAQNFAFEWSQQHEPAGGHNDAQDALRHAIWSAKMAYAYGEEYAKKWGDAHELNPLQPEDEKIMDLFNNAVGRSIGGPAGSNLDQWPTVEQGILNAINNGGLCLSPGAC